MSAAGVGPRPVWEPGAGQDRWLEAREIEGEIRVALRRNTRLDGHQITVKVGSEGLVTLTGAVGTQELRREVELACWTVSGVLGLHDELVVGR